MNKLNNYERYCYGGMYIWYDNDEIVADEIVATVKIEKIDSVGWIENLYVSPSYRQHGLCKELLNFAIALGGEKLAVRKENKKAISIYIKYGFETFDEGEKFYHMKLRENNNG